MGPPNSVSGAGNAYYTPDLDDHVAGTVQLGENSLAAIARNRKIDPALLQEANPGIDLNSPLQVGQSFNLPQSTTPHTKPPQPEPVPPRSTSSSSPSPIGDPVAQSAMKARLSEPEDLSGKKEDYVPLNPIRPGNT